MDRKGNVQSPKVFCLKSVTDGYQAEFSLFKNQRQSCDEAKTIQVGQFNAPERWPIEVSHVITKSKFSIIAAVSKNAWLPLSISLL